MFQNCTNANTLPTGYIALWSKGIIPALVLNVWHKQPERLLWMNLAKVDTLLSSERKLPVSKESFVMLRLFSLKQLANHECGIKSIFRPTEIDAKDREVRKLGGKFLINPPKGEKLASRPESRAVRKNKSSKNRNYNLKAVKQVVAYLKKWRFEHNRIALASSSLEKTVSVIIFAAEGAALVYSRNSWEV